MTNYDISQLQIITLNTGYAEHHADWNWRDVRSPFARLYYVTEGEAWVEIENRCIHLIPGHLYMIPPFTKHHNICHGHFCHFYIHVYENPGEFSFLEDLQYPYEILAEEHDEQLFRRLALLNPSMRLPASNPASYDNHEMLLHNIAMNKQRKFWNIVESQGILFILLSRFLKLAEEKQTVKNERISQTISFIRKHITERINLDSLAGMACMSKDHFIRVFHLETGETPNAYIIRLKMERAELLLITTDMPIKNISDTLGYEEVSYFNRLFKDKIGKTPLNYRMGKQIQ